MAEAGGMDLGRALILLRVNLALISLIVAATLVVTLIATMLQTPRYTAVTSLQINNQPAQVLGKDEDISQTEPTSPLDTERFLQTQMDILNSRALAERVANRLKLIGNADFYRYMGAREPDPTLPKSELKEFTLNLLLNGHDARLPRNSRLATVAFTSTDPAFSAKLANIWADEFIQANLQRRYDSSAYARDFISGQLDEAKAKLQQSEIDLNNYARVAGLIRARDSAAAAPEANGSGSGNSVTTSSLMQINAAANEAKANRIIAEQKWALLAGGNLLNSPDVLSNSTVASLLADRAKLQADYERERSKHLDDYPTVIQLKTQLAATNDQIDKVAKNIRASVRQQYDTAIRAEQSLNSQVRSLVGSSLAEQDRSVQYNLLARDADTNRLLYEGLLQRFKELNAAAGISASNISIIDQADAPTEQSSPKLVRNMAIAFAISLFVAIAVTFLRDQFDDAVRVPEDVESKLGIALLGVTPKSSENSPNEDLSDPKSPLSESYNSLCSALLYAKVGGLPRTLLVTSSQPAEGKSTTSLAVARGFARMGRKVALVDVDLRRPTLHRTAGFKNDNGVSTFLTAQSDIDAVIRPSDLENLYLVGSGPIPPNPTDLLSGPRLGEMIEKLKEKFDVVIFDSPPVLGLADAPLLAGAVEGVVIVVASSRNRRGSLKASIRRLRNVRSNILGAALTMFDVNKSGNRYSEYYGYNYYRYQSQEDN
ncbi:GumC family protein [Novosphingobium sp.]|uniref:GumC family protein n=1 Tax=Novosphingobium sp. TaxID=1874826 RepID=UPI0038BDACCD